MEKKILVTGATGMLGSAICRSFLAHPEFQLSAVIRNKNLDLPSIAYIRGDLCDPELCQKLRADEYYAVIHCAAETNVNLCEKNPSIAQASNVSALKSVLFNTNFERFIHFSTDSVFDGQKGNYLEQDPVGPLSVYSKTKLEAEQIISESSPNTLILRTNLYGFRTPFGTSLFEWAFQELQQNHTLNGFSNMYFNPLYVGQIAQTIQELLALPHQAGTFHLASDTIISKYDFLVHVAKSFGFPENLVRAQEFQQTPGIAPRPLNTTLRNDKLKRVFPQLKTCLSVETGFAMLHNDFISQKEECHVTN